MASLQDINKRFNAVMPFITPIGVVLGLNRYGLVKAKT